MQMLIVRAAAEAILAGLYAWILYQRHLKTLTKGTA